MGVEEEFDWRIWGVTTLAEDYKPAYPVGMSYKVGTPVYPVAVTIDRESGEMIEFGLPNPSKLAISIAINASHNADALRKSIALSPAYSFSGERKRVEPENLKRLYDYFESCMVTVTFSYQALETYSNCIIADRLKGTIPIKMNKKLKHLNSKQLLEDNVSTEKKLRTVLPKILNIESPEKNEEIWQNYLELKRVRNTTVHMKYSDATSGVNIDKKTLLYEFFRTEMDIFPKYALDMIDYFESNGNNRYWIDHARHLLENGE